MAHPEQTTDFPLSNMPRMGRRNAIAYPNRILSDDDGAFSPMSLLHSASASDMDPQGVIAQELRHERQNQEGGGQKEKGGITAVHGGSVLDGWKKLHDAKNHMFNGIERLFEQTGPLAPSTSVVEAKPIKSYVEEITEKDKAAASASTNHRGNIVIPWKKKDLQQTTTIAEERRKLFQSFDMTSLEPPDTPQISELTLKKLAKKMKRKKKESNKASRESVTASLPGKFKDANKPPYSEVQAKVVTRWEKDKMDAISLPPNSKLKGSNLPDALNKENKKSPNTGLRNGSLKPLQHFPIRKQASSVDQKSKLVTNYPASEKIKNTTMDKLPLTIPPRYNHKKALGMTAPPKHNKTEELDGSNSRLFGTIPRMRHEAPRPGGNSLRSTFFNLQRINNGGAAAATGQAKATTATKRVASTGQVVVGRFSANILGTPTIGGAPLPVRKPTPPVTTIHNPKSLFLASKISVQSQMNVIPINGEKYVPFGSVRENKKENKDKGETKPGKTQSQQPGTSGKAKTPAAAQRMPVKPSKPETSNKTAQPPTKVVPTLGPVPNKYNNIYIGPYSGSESEGEGTSKRKR